MVKSIQFSLFCTLLIACSVVWSLAAADSPPTPPAKPAAVPPAKPKNVEPATFPTQPTPPVHTPEEELKTFQLPEGYKLELVLSDPDIKEPVQAVFDGNGRIYVAEMRSYMQDIDANHEQDPIGRVSRHESTKGDGVYDKHTVYADGLLLPRMVLPLDRGQVLIGQTNSSDFYNFLDTDDEGVSDGKVLFYDGGPRGGNLEHQPSGLVWAMDNGLYTTVNAYRLRWRPHGPTTKESTAGNGGQWGLCQDDDGKLWWSNGGGEKGLWHFQTPILYGSVDVKEQFSSSFLEVWPLVPIPDVQGGANRFRPEEKTLNHVTACGGQQIFRGDRLPKDLYGDALLCEPVGRLIRRSKVTVDDGITYLTNPYEPKKSEFIRSTDPYFRPVNMITGPDGCLYIVDMYRGIIQEGNWTKEGSYLRKVIQQYGLDKAVGRGRVWRLVHKDFTPGPQPHMLDETPAQLVAHLEHPNGWWRDTAQKLLVLRQDKSVVPALAAMARNSANPIARMHALWTLEGLGEIDPELVRERLDEDPSPRVRAAAIRVSETLFNEGNNTLEPDVRALIKDPDPGVVLQVIMTAKHLKWQDWQRFATITVATSPSQGVQSIGRQLLYTPKTFDPKQFNSAQLNLLKKGETVYEELCFACHGYDGKGMPMDGRPLGTTIAPPLAEARMVLGPSEGLSALLLHGLAGPVDGKTYDAQMIPMRDNSDEWVASVASYVRNSFGNSASVITTAEVTRMRNATKGRTQPWTIDELKLSILPPALTNRAKWKVTASANPKAAVLAIDGNPETRYTTGCSQAPGQWFQVELPEPTLIGSLLLDTGKSKGDYPRGYKVELSLDGAAWGKPVAEGKGNTGNTEITFPPVQTKFVRITQTGSTQGTYWSIHDLQIFQPGKTAASTPTVREATKKAG